MRTAFIGCSLKQRGWQHLLQFGFLAFVALIIVIGRNGEDFEYKTYVCAPTHLQDERKYWRNVSLAFQNWSYDIRDRYSFCQNIDPAAICHSICSASKNFLSLSHTRHHMGQCDILYYRHLHWRILCKPGDRHEEIRQSNELIVWQCKYRRNMRISDVPKFCRVGDGRGVLTGSANVATDFLILLLPLPVILRLQVPFKKKIRLLLVFGIGLFACVASVVRLVYSLQVNVNADPKTYQLNLDRSGLWGWVKCNFFS